MRTIFPSVNDIANPTVLVSIQDNRGASANGDLISRDLDIRTEFVDGERIRNSLTTVSRVSSDSVNTGRNIDTVGEDTCGPLIVSSTFSTSDQQSGITVANDVVTCDSQQGRSSLNGNGSIGRDTGNTTFRADGASIDVVRANSGQVEVERIQVFTRNLNTVEIPNIGNSLRSTGDGSHELGLVAFAEDVVLRTNNRRNSRSVVDNNRDACRIGATIVHSCHSVSRSSIRLNVNCRVICRSCVPNVNHIAVNHALEIGVQGNMLAFADAGSSSGDLQVGTEGTNREAVGSGVTTSDALSDHIVDARTSLEGRIRGERTTIPRIHVSTVGSSNQSSGFEVANKLFTRNRNIRRSREDNSISVYRRNSGLTTSGRKHDLSRIDIDRDLVVVGVNILAERALVSTRNLNAVSVPCIDSVGAGRSNRSGKGDLCTVAERVRSNTVDGDSRDNRIRIDSDIHRVAGSITEGVELLSSEGVSMSTFRRNNRVGQGGGTGNQDAIVVPLVLHVRSIPVVQVSGQGDFTTNADFSLSSGNVHNRNSVNIDDRLSSGLATVLVHQGNAEVIRIISVRSRQNHHSIVRTSSTGENTIVLKPCEGVVRGRLRIDMGNHRDVVGTIATDDRISFDGQRRVRVDRNSVGEGHDGLATGSRLLDGNFIDINRRIIADSVRGLSVNCAHSTRNDFTVSVPREDLTTSDTARNSSREGHGTTVAQSSGRRQIAVDNNGRIISHVHSNRIAGSMTEGVELLSREGVSMSTRRRNNRVGQGGGTGNNAAVVVPLVLHVRSIPVVQVSGQGDFTTNADFSLSSGNVHNRNSVNIDDRLSSGLATVLVHQGNAEVIRIISVRSRQNHHSIVRTSSTGENTIVLKPCEGVVRGRLRIDMGNHRDVVGTIATDDRISFDGQRRVRVDRNSVGEGHDGLATGSRLLDGNFIDINRRIIADSVRGLSVNCAHSTRNDFTVSVPREDLTTSDTARNSSREGHGTTVAQSSGRRQIAVDNNGRIRIDGHINRVARSLAEGVELLSSEGVSMIAIRRNNRVGQ